MTQKLLTPNTFVSPAVPCFTEESSLLTVAKRIRYPAAVGCPAHIRVIGPLRHDG